MGHEFLDTRSLGVAARQLGLRRAKPAEKVLGMMSSLDHSVFFYEYVLEAIQEKPRTMTLI